MRALLVQFQQKMTKAVDIQDTESMRLTAIHATVIMSNQNTVCMNTPFPFTVLAQSQSVSAALKVDHQALITFQPAVVSSMKSIIGHPLWIYPG